MPLDTAYVGRKKSGVNMPARMKNKDMIKRMNFGCL